MTAKARTVLLALALLGLVACRDEVAQDVSPVEVSAETLGHFCQMNLLEHPGPKAQVHLEGVPGGPLFFSQVRDAIAYARAPEQMAPILAIHVNDMGADGATWEMPGDGNWIDADAAFYVLGSGREGGMGAPETVPFASRAAAENFAAREGGRVLTLAEIPDAAVLAPVEQGGPQAAPDDDFEQRLRALSRPNGG
ncbi:nitrous oxide reductase accessory protein NosL [Paracoccus sp. XHP0099]|uniref:Nitrous oxide reductase accessory protein NosL n=2 Tax=Paracoccus marinaquae TaxID=2841926 RepID=A0ABS6AJ18_9RHOB|nr:nitrous oxide reductase accessory protein NosL [Paracoccus marinaquae]